MAGKVALVDAATCLSGNAERLLATLVESFNPVAQLFNASGFLFLFVGAGFTPISGLTGSTTAEVAASITSLQSSLNSIRSTVSSVCP